MSMPNGPMVKPDTASSSYDLLAVSRMEKRWQLLFKP